MQALFAIFPGERFGNLAIHTVPIGEFDGPYSFFNSSGKLL
jgi:hypothetical protein